MNKKCETCIKRKTLFCPTSIKCMATDDKPYYQDKIMLLEENKQLKERIAYLERSNNRREDTILEQRQEISDLEENWNKLKKNLEKEGFEINTKEYGILEVVSKDIVFETTQKLEGKSNYDNLNIYSI